MVDVVKRFPGVVANDRVSFDVRAGEVHALLGENGAGKTTLMNILYGLYRPDEGRVLLDGAEVRFRSPRDAMARGIGLVAQHFHLADRHTVVENVALGLPGTPWWRPSRALARRVRETGERYGLELDPSARVAALSPGERQRVEIVKALLQGARILVLDEPTSVLAPQEAEALFRVLDVMKGEGKAVVFISHKLDEVERVADRVTVLRKGRVEATLDAGEADAAGLARLMVGREPPRPRAKGLAPLEALALRVEGLTVRGDRGVDAVRDVSFDLRRGEVLGVAGVAGNGQAELIEALTGLRRPAAGRILLGGPGGLDLGPLDARRVLEAGVACIPEDRNRTGIVPSFSVQENLMLRRYRYHPFSRGPLLSPGAARRFADDAIREHGIRAPGRDAPARLLSGGNVQKLILARELDGEPRLVIASHPTYGLDVGATALTQDLLLAQRERGAGVLLVSEDLEEVLGLSDRVLVLHGGRSMGVVDAAGADREEIGLMMAGRPAPSSGPSAATA